MSTRWAKNLIEKLQAVERSGDGATIHDSRTHRQHLFGAVELVELGDMGTNDPFFQTVVDDAERWLKAQGKVVSR